METTHGATPEHLTALARRHRTVARSIGGRSLRAMAWSGPDADRHRRAARSLERHLRSVDTILLRSADLLDRHASDQSAATQPSESAAAVTVATGPLMPPIHQPSTQHSSRYEASGAFGYTIDGSVDVTASHIDGTWFVGGALATAVGGGHRVELRAGRVGGGLDLTGTVGTTQTVTYAARSAEDAADLAPRVAAAALLSSGAPAGRPGLVGLVDLPEPVGHTTSLDIGVDGELSIAGLSIGAGATYSFEICSGAPFDGQRAVMRGSIGVDASGPLGAAVDHLAPLVGIDPTPSFSGEAVLSVSDPVDGNRVVQVDISHDGSLTSTWWNVSASQWDGLHDRSSDVARLLDVLPGDSPAEAIGKAAQVPSRLAPSGTWTGSIATTTDGSRSVALGPIRLGSESSTTTISSSPDS